MGGMDEVVGAQLVLSLGRQAAQLLVGQLQRRGDQVLLVVLQVHDVRARVHGGERLGQRADVLPRRERMDDHERR